MEANQGVNIIVCLLLRSYDPSLADTYILGTSLRRGPGPPSWQPTPPLVQLGFGGWGEWSMLCWRCRSASSSTCRKIVVACSADRATGSALWSASRSASRRRIWSFWERLQRLGRLKQSSIVLQGRRQGCAEVRGLLGCVLLGCVLLGRECGSIPYVVWTVWDWCNGAQVWCRFL